jgi:anthranilate synthase component 1
MEVLRTVDAAALDRYRLAHCELPADALTPVLAAARLRAAGRRVCVLESAGGPDAPAPYSYVAFDPRASFTSDGQRSVLRRGDDATGARGGLLDGLRALAREHCPGAPRPAGLPPFLGGLVGHLAFEFASLVEPSFRPPERDELGAPLASFEAFATVLAFDHRAQTLHLSTLCPGGSRDRQAALARLDAALHDLSASAGAPLAGAFHCDGLTPLTTRDEFMAGIERARDHVAAGDVFQVVLSRQSLGKYHGDPFALYRALRVENGAPHMFFFETDELTLVGSSPERLVDVRGGRIGSAPIAGTRPRGRDEREDRANEEELCANAKERSEHDMLVDLARNDVGRVARIGSVAVSEYARTQRLRRVMHLVSRVEGDLAGGRDAFDALAATFPAGTVSGAPKVRALQILSEIEGLRRGPYGGAFGLIGHGLDLDMALVIRTFALRAGRIALQAGAGVVHASTPEGEAAEVDAKLAGPLAALARAVRTRSVSNAEEVLA